MRIISGKAKKIKLAPIKTSSIEPTAERTKEALFSILYSRGIEGSFLDLFAGSGQIGLEAASRGFAPVVLVERSKEAQRIIDLNLKKTALTKDVTLLQMDVFEAVKQLADYPSKFDLIFLDPPWAAAVQIFAKLAQGLFQILKDDGLVVLEHHKNVKSPDAVTVLEYLNSCNYGSAVLSFYKKAAL